MGLETATFISELVDTNPTGSDVRSQGDDHFRLIKIVLQTQFPNLTAAALNATVDQFNRLVGMDADVAPDLVDNGNSFNIGVLAGAHLAQSGAHVQAKGSATTAANLFLNALGGIIKACAAAGRMDILSTLAVALDDNTNALNIGDIVGSHLAFGPGNVQAKASATTAEDLLLNALGGDVELATKLKTVDRTAADISSGAQVHDGGGTYRSVGFNIQPINAQTGTTYTVDKDDSGHVVEMNNASANLVTLPNDSNIEVGAMINVVQKGAGVTSVETASGVTMRFSDGTASAAKTVILNNQYAWVSCTKESDTVWYVTGAAT